MLALADEHRVTGHFALGHIRKKLSLSTSTTPHIVAKAITMVPLVRFNSLALAILCREEHPPADDGASHSNRVDNMEDPAKRWFCSEAVEAGEWRWVERQGRTQQARA